MILPEEYDREKYKGCFQDTTPEQIRKLMSILPSLDTARLRDLELWIEENGDYAYWYPEGGYATGADWFIAYLADKSK